MKKETFSATKTEYTLLSLLQRSLSGMQRYGFFRHAQRRGEANWKAYHKHPWLKPFAWLYQLLRYVVLWVKSPKKDRLSGIVKQGSETGKLLKRLRQMTWTIV